MVNKPKVQKTLQRVHLVLQDASGDPIRIKKIAENSSCLFHIRHHSCQVLIGLPVTFLDSTIRSLKSMGCKFHILSGNSVDRP